MDRESLELVASLPGLRFVDDQPIPLNCTAHNRSSHSLTLWSRAFCANQRITVFDAEGKEATLTDDGEACRAAFGQEESDKNRPIQLAAGADYPLIGTVDLRSYYRLPIGHYSVDMTYEDNQPPTPLSATSNRVKFEVVAR